MHKMTLQKKVTWLFKAREQCPFLGITTVQFGTSHISTGIPISPCLDSSPPWAYKCPSFCSLEKNSNKVVVNGVGIFSTRSNTLLLVNQLRSNGAG